MKKLCLAIIFYFSIINIAVSQLTLTIEIENIKNDTGTILIELLDSDKKQVANKIGIITNGNSTIIFDDLKFSNYAIRYFHDANENKKLDKNMLGVPKEGYGFSNNAYGSFKPKKFNKWLFRLSENTTITLKTKN